MCGRRRIVRHPAYGTPLTTDVYDRCQAPSHVCALCAEDKRWQTLTADQRAQEIREQRVRRAAERAHITRTVQL